MGSSCLKALGFGKPEPKKADLPPEETTRQTSLIEKKAPRALALHYHTQHDLHFTYFLEAFDLLALQHMLREPQYIDELHPRFSYAKFNIKHKEYQHKVNSLGQYIKSYKDDNSALQHRIRKDRDKITTTKKEQGVDPNQKGCIVKVEIQSFKGKNVTQIGVVHTHHRNWDRTFEKWTKKETVDNEPVFMEFPVADIEGSMVKVYGRPSPFQVSFDLSQLEAENKSNFCQIYKWPQAHQSEGIGLRIQLVFENVQEEQERVMQMEELYNSLAEQFLDDKLISASRMTQTLTQREVSQRISRHRSSLSKHYNLSDNAFF